MVSDISKGLVRIRWAVGASSKSTKTLIGINLYRNYGSLTPVCVLNTALSEAFKCSTSMEKKLISHNASATRLDGLEILERLPQSLAKGINDTQLKPELPIRSMPCLACSPPGTQSRYQDRRPSLS